MRWLVLVVLAACYSPSPYESCEVSCELGADCPPGLACFDQLCSERVAQCTEHPNGDSDDDGVANRDDKCPGKQAQDNHDHDGDSLGDPCDPCPFLTDNTDGDGDGVGDRCDPDPTTPGDLRAAFYGFYETTDIASWAQTGNTWVVATGKLISSQVGPGGFAEPPIAFASNLAIYASMTYMLEPTTSVERYAGVTARRADAGNLQACYLSDSNGAKAVVLRTLPDMTQMTEPFLGVVGGTHDIRLILDGSGGRCQVDSKSVTRTLEPSMGRKIAIDASHMYIEVDYLFVVTMP